MVRHLKLRSEAMPKQPAWRFKPSPPAFKEIKITSEPIETRWSLAPIAFRVGSSLKAAKASSRACIVMPPRKTTQEMPARFKRNSTNLDLR